GGGGGFHRARRRTLHKKGRGAPSRPRLRWTRAGAAFFRPAAKSLQAPRHAESRERPRLEAAHRPRRRFARNPGLVSPMDLKKEFPVDRVFLAHAAVSPLPARTACAVAELALAMSRRGQFHALYEKAETGCRH